MARRQHRNTGRRCTCAAEGGEHSPGTDGASNHPWLRCLMAQRVAAAELPVAAGCLLHLASSAGCGMLSGGAASLWFNSLKGRADSPCSCSTRCSGEVIGLGEPCRGLGSPLPWRLAVLVLQRGAESPAWALNSAPGCGGQWPNVTQELRGAERGVILPGCSPCMSAGLASCLAQGMLDREAPALHSRGACRPPQADGVLSGDSPDKGSHNQEHWLPQQAAQSERSHPCGSHCSVGR